MDWGYGIAFFRALNFQISEPEIWRKSLWLRNLRILLEISASEKYFSDSGKWPFHTPPIHTPTKCRPTKVSQRQTASAQKSDTWLPKGGEEKKRVTQPLLPPRHLLHFECMWLSCCLLCATECTKIAHRRSLASFYRRRGYRREFRSEDHFFTRFHRRRNRGSLPIFFSEEVAHLGASKSRDFSGSRKNRRCNRKESRDFGALRIVAHTMPTLEDTLSLMCWGEGRCKAELDTVSRRWPALFFVHIASDFKSKRVAV